jgi:hypothetical protein
MKIQNVPGIYVYYVDDGLCYVSRKLRYFYFDTWNSFFNYFTTYKLSDRFGDWDDIWHSVDMSSRYSAYAWQRIPVSHFAVYDQDGNWYSIDALAWKAHEYRKAQKKKGSAWIHQKRHGRKKSAWGHYHPITTFRSNREDYLFPEAEDYDIIISYRRKAVPPDSWDREKCSHQEKCWKRQSKREHQWK